mgnify:CR=1 FL=1
MKKLPLPAYDDAEIITALSNNNGLTKTSYPHLRDAIEIIKDGYAHYLENRGDAWVITVDLISKELKKGLLKNYQYPPKELKHLQVLRDSSQNVCVMCGSERAVNLDHVFPKENHSQWAVFSKNLVPGCKCNIGRGAVSTGCVDSKQRVLHPYFDECLAQRLLSCEIIPDEQFRLANIRLRYLQPELPEHESIKFHVENVVVRSGLLKWLDSQWPKLRSNPCNIIHRLPRNTIHTLDELRLHLEDSISRFDGNTGTPNNWNSILIHGLLTSNRVLEWLLVHHNGIISGEINPEDN